MTKHEVEPHTAGAARRSWRADDLEVAGPAFGRSRRHPQLPPPAHQQQQPVLREPVSDGQVSRQLFGTLSGVGGRPGLGDANSRTGTAGSPSSPARPSTFRVPKRCSSGATRCCSPPMPSTRSVSRTVRRGPRSSRRRRTSIRRQRPDSLPRWTCRCRKPRASSTPQAPCNPSTLMRPDWRPLREHPAIAGPEKVNRFVSCTCLISLLFFAGSAAAIDRNQ